jgi:hypothetical protein
MVKNRNALYIVLISASAYLFSMEEGEDIPLMTKQEIEIKDIDNALNKTYEWCPKPYADTECMRHRKQITGTLGMPLCVVATIAKGSVWCYSLRSNTSCDDSCTDCNALWFSHCNDQCCDSIDTCMLPTFTWGTTTCIVVGLITMACAWAPWYNKNGCNLRKKIVRIT